MKTYYICGGKNIIYSLYLWKTNFNHIIYSSKIFTIQSMI